MMNGEEFVVLFNENSNNSVHSDSTKSNRKAKKKRFFGFGQREKQKK
jgi:hypothetical protein